MWGLRLVHKQMFGKDVLRPQNRNPLTSEGFQISAASAISANLPISWGWTAGLPPSCPLLGNLKESTVHHSGWGSQKIRTAPKEL